MWYVCRYHACSLICILACCACDPGHKSEETPALLAALSARALLPRVAHLSFSFSNNSCLHASFLEVFSTHTLPYMPAPLWQPLLEDNLGCPPSIEPHLPPLPALLLQHGVSSAITCMLPVALRLALTGHRVTRNTGMQRPRRCSQGISAYAPE